jgi:hypothetical protein
LDEKLVTVMIELGRQPANYGFAGFRYKKEKGLAGGEELKLWREEGRMWVFIRPRGGQDWYLLTCELTEGPEYCPIHRFDGLDQVPLHGRRMPTKK